MFSIKWILHLTWAFMFPIIFSKECVYNVTDLTSSTLFSANNTVLPTIAHAMIIRTPNFNQSCVLSLRNLPLNWFQKGISVYYFVCTSIFSVRLDMEGIPETNSSILYLQIEKCLLGFDEIRKLTMIYNLKVLSYFNLMPTEEALQIQNESQVFENVVAYSISLNHFSDKQPWIFTANHTFPSMIELSFEGIGLKNLPPDMTVRFPNIQSLELVNNKLTYIPKLEFNNTLYPLPLGLTRTPQMQHHYADSIGIKVGPSFFRKILILDQNHISSLEDFSFNGTLHKISVAKNKLIHISPRTFANIQGLNSIDLSHNFLSSLPELTFENCNHLLILILSNNNLSEIPANVFKNNQKLLKLDLSQNNLTFLQAGTFSKLKSLKYLDLSQNNIEKFQNQTFPKDLGSLEEIKLSNNNFRNFPIEFFMHSRIKLIDLHSCKITNMNFTEILDSVNDMQITDIHSSHVSISERQMTEINLSNNLIKTLNFWNFQESHTKKMLMLLNNFKFDFSRNPIECDCHLLSLLDFFQKAKEDKIYSVKKYFYQNWKCHSPPEFQNRPILSLSKEDLYCHELLTDCPKKCFCYQRPINKMVIVDCRGRQLTSLPNRMPSGNLELWFQYNNISKIEQRNYLQRIEILNLNNNQISDINDVKYLKNLKQAFFASNLLVSLPSDIQEIPFNSLNISWNHFRCDCNNLWLKSWLSSVQDKVQGWFDIKCRTYKRNIQAIINIPDTDFKCHEEKESLIKYIEIVGISIITVVILACILIFIKLRNPIICSSK